MIATRWEAAPVLKHFHFKRAEKNLYRAEIAGRPVWLCLSGIGPEPAHTAAARLCRYGVKELISAGFCGALSEHLKVGDVITDRIASVAYPLQTREERRAAASRGAQAVDMETKAVIEAGTRAGVSIRVIRVVSDEVGDDLSPLFGPEGNTSPLHIALRLLNPAVWPLANRLRRNSAIAKERLVAALAQHFSV